MEMRDHAHFFYEEDSFGVFVLVTVVLGGGAAWLDRPRHRRDLAAAWWHVVGYMLMLGAAVRFFHFALFDGTLLSPHYYRRRHAPSA